LDLRGKSENYFLIGKEVIKGINGGMSLAIDKHEQSIMIHKKRTQQKKEE
jgi:hypothetical protein